jgi:hypothetical protein
MQAKSRMELWSEPLSFWGMEASLASTSYHATRLEMFLYSAAPRKPIYPYLLEFLLVLL